MARCLIFLLLSIRSVAALTEFGVTYEFSGGRFGDCLLSYLHAKWLAHTKNIPLFYRPFPYSSQLTLHTKEFPYANLKGEPRLRSLIGNCPLNPRITLPILYICPYFPEDLWEQRYTLGLNGLPWQIFTVNWKDLSFRQAVHEMLAPLQTLELITPPSNCITIAIHFREGGGFDDALAHAGWPLKFPPLNFYIEALTQAIDLFPGKPIYCFLFTDALNPQLYAAQIVAALPQEISLTLDYRRVDNSPSKHVLEDFFSFFHFDVLIRPQSNFSMIPSLIHDFALVYSPESFSRQDENTQITEIKVGKNEPLLERLLR